MLSLNKVVLLAALAFVNLTKSLDDFQSNLVQEKRSDSSFLEFLFMSLQKTVEEQGQIIKELQKTVARLSEQSEVEQDGTCPMGFTLYGSKCYRVFDVLASWIEAKMYCRALGADLAVIDNVYKHNFLKQLIEKGPKKVIGYWLDGTDLPYINNWYWMGKNDKTYKAFTFYNWHSSQPNDHSTYSTCMGMWKDFRWLWHDLDCSRRDQGFICQA